MPDNLTGGRVIMAFPAGHPSEDLPYGMNPAEGRARLFEGMDLLLKALTEPPFSWEGRYYQFRTVSVCPRPVQQPLPPVIVATRSEDAVRYAASHQRGWRSLMIRWIRWPKSLRSTARGVPRPAGSPHPTRSSTAPVSCSQRRPAGGKSAGALKASGLGNGGMDLRSSVTWAVFVARDGKAFDPRNRNVAAGDTQEARQAVQSRRGLLTLVEGPRDHREAAKAHSMTSAAWAWWTWASSKPAPTTGK